MGLHLAGNNFSAFAVRPPPLKRETGTRYSVSCCHADQGQMWPVRQTNRLHNDDYFRKWPALGLRWVIEGANWWCFNWRHDNDSRNAFASADLRTATDLLAFYISINISPLQQDARNVLQS